MSWLFETLKIRELVSAVQATAEQKSGYGRQMGVSGAQFKSVSTGVLISP
jgi:hypothetical protein